MNDTRREEFCQVTFLKYLLTLVSKNNVTICKLFESKNYVYPHRVTSSLELYEVLNNIIFVDSFCI